MRTNHPRPSGLFFAIAFSLVALGVARVARADVVIDSFDNSLGTTFGPLGNTGLSPGSGPPLGIVEFDAYQAPIPDVAGGIRHLRAAIDAMPITPDVETVNAVTSGSTSFLDYHGANSVGGTLLLAYGVIIPGTFFTTGSGFALPMNPATDAIRLTFLNYVRPAGSDTEVDLIVDSTTIPTVLTAEGAQTLDIPLTELTGNVLDEVSLTFNAPPGTAFQLDSIAFVTTAPEPSTVATVAFGLSLLMSRRRPRHLHRERLPARHS